MLKTSITIPVVPSRLGWWCQWSLALLVVAAVLSFGPSWLALPALAWLAGLGVWLWRAQPRGTLYRVPEAGGECWLWRPVAAQEPLPLELHCHYLGPWLLALRVNGGRLWLWPDSAPQEAMRQLRRGLLH